MPKIISRQPAWLSRSSPAYRLFDGVTSPQLNGEYQSSEGKLEAPGLRTLAHRGSEVFVADGNSIRWADLASMKADWEVKEFGEHLNVEDDDPLVGVQFRVLQFKYVVEPIIQLSISPNQSVLAIVTAHTVHVCTIPDSKHLSEPDDGPLTPRLHMVGNTTHVLSSARIISALWHPFGVGGHCLVTITCDAVVRLWELNLANRSTIEQPTLSIDLRKLRNARSIKDDVRPRGLGISEGISYNSIGMEVASACFGGTGAEQELGWAGMTLWVAMTEGDVYAICPLLPTKWQAYPAILPNLATTILADKDQQETEIEKADFLAQYRWISEQGSGPVLDAPRQTEFQQRSWIYTRPKNISAVPKLQGPFSIIPGDLEYELALADIHVVAPRFRTKSDNTELLNGMPVSMVCLLTQLASVYVCAELQGIHGQWLPEKAPAADGSDDDSPPELVVLGAVDTFKRSAKNMTSLAGWPTLSPDATSQYAFYVAHSKGVWFVSAEKWIESLESEMSSTTTAGTGFRMGVGVEGSNILRQEVMSLLESEEDQPSAPLSIEDSDLGHLILTIYDSTPHVAILDSPHVTKDMATSTEPQIKQEARIEVGPDISIQVLPRMSYAPSKAFRQDFGSFKDRLRRPIGTNTKLNQVTMNEQIRLSPAILELMTHDHRVLSEETHKLGLAIADLFRRCNMMQQDFKTQIARVREIAGRVDHVHGDDQEDDDENNNAETLNHRLIAAEKRQHLLFQRFGALRKKTRTIGRPLSDREKNWMSEVDRLARELPEDINKSNQTIVNDEMELEHSKASNPQQGGRYVRRYNEVQQLTKGLCSQVDSISKDKVSSTDGGEESRPQSPASSITSFSTSRGLRVPPDIRKQKMIVLENSMERQTALLDATMERLERLGIDL